MKKLALALGALLVCAGIAYSQSATGRITGNVADPSGRVMVGAQVTTTNVQTGVVSETQSNADGLYQILELPIGEYTVRVQMPGFETAVTRPNRLQINQTLRIDITLSVGTVTQTVVVEDTAPQVETVNPTIGSTVATEAIKNLPLNGRNTMDLLNTVPGYSGGSIVGGRTDNVSYLLDGGNNNNVRSGNVGFNPNPDTVAEFRVLMNNYTAEYGRSGGGIVSVVTKSGTNQYHFTMFDYFRNTVLNANNFFLNSSGQPRAILQRNQYGGTLGGPLSIPGVFNAKDKLFFFFGFQGQRQNQTSVGSVATVYTSAMLNGDFSKANNGRPDTRVAAFLAKYPYFQPNPTLAAQAIIDPTRVSPVFSNLNKAGLIVNNAIGSITPTQATKSNYDQYTGKVDYAMSAGDRISGTVGYQNTPTLPSGSVGFPLQSLNETSYVNLNYTKTFSPSLLNDFRAAVNRILSVQNNPTTSTPGPRDLGININPDRTFGSPQITLPSGFLSLGYNPNNSDLADTTWSYSDTMTWVKLRHTLKAGGSFNAAQSNSMYNYQTMGLFTFSGVNSQIGSGNPMADFFMGLPDSFSQYPSATSNMRQKQFSLFVQDEWKVSRKVQLSFGLRYENLTPQKDLLGRSFSLLPGVQSQRFTAAPVGMVFPGDPGAPEGLYFPDKNNFAPRFGIAYDPFGNGKTSIRAGAGVFFNLLSGWIQDWNNGVPPYYAGTSFSSNAGNPLPAGFAQTPRYMTDPYTVNGYPNPFPSKVALNSTDPKFFENLAALPFGGSAYLADPHLRTPYIYQYNVSVQRQLARDLALDVSYVGSISHKLTNQMDLNPMILGTNVRILNVGRYPYFTDPVRGLTTNGLTQLANSSVNEGKANYSGLLSSLTKRFGKTKGIGSTYFTAAYTWSHNIDNGTGAVGSANGNVPYYNRMALYSNSAQDQRQRFTFAGGWDLPFDDAWGGGPRRLTAGWTLLPILTVTTGSYFDILAGLTQNNPVRSKVGPSGAGDVQLVRARMNNAFVTTYPDVKDQNIVVGTATRTGLYYLNPNDFSVPTTWNQVNYMPTAAERTYGMPRNAIIGPKNVNLDMALTKKTALFGEKLKSEFRFEAFNVFNHTQFSNPNVSISSALLGRVTAVRGNRVGQLALRLEF